MKNSTRNILHLSVLALAMCCGRIVVADTLDAPSRPSAEEAGYAYGVNFGEQLSRLGITDQVPLDAIMRGFKDALSGKRRTQPGDVQIVQQYIGALHAETVARNHAAAREFLDRNATAAGVHKTASGLQYKVISNGDRKAASPQPTDMVTVQYRGTLLDGSEFDNSYSRGAPATFPLNGVIKGWQEAIPLMKPGAKWQIFVPPELGYDATVRPGIPMGSLLIFDVELVSVTSPAHASVTPPPAAPASPAS